MGIIRDDLGVRADVIFRTLLVTGIGRTVQRLTKHGDAVISEAAIRILERLREIDVSTPESEKAAIEASFNAAPVVGSGAGACDRHRGAGPAVGKTPGTPVSTLESETAAMKGSLDLAPVVGSAAWACCCCQGAGAALCGMPGTPALT